MGIGAHVFDDDGFAVEGTDVEGAFADGDGAFVDIRVSEGVGGLEVEGAGLFVEEAQTRGIGADGLGDGFDDDFQDLLEIEGAGEEARSFAYAGEAFIEAADLSVQAGGGLADSFRGVFGLMVFHIFVAFARH